MENVVVKIPIVGLDKINSNGLKISKETFDKALNEYFENNKEEFKNLRVSEPNTINALEVPIMDICGRINGFEVTDEGYLLNTEIDKNLMQGKIVASMLNDGIQNMMQIMPLGYIDPVDNKLTITSFNLTF